MQSDLNKDIKISEKNHLLLKTINELTLNRLNISDINEARKKILEEVGKAFNCDRCYIRLFNDFQKKFLKIDESSEYLKSSKVKSFLNYDFHIEFYEMINHFKTRNSTNYNEEVICLPNWLEQSLELHKENTDLVKKLAEEFSIKSAYRSIIKNGSEVMGIFIINYTEDFVYLDEEEIKIIEIISQKLAYILKQAEFIEINKKINEREILLRKIIKKISDIKNIDEIKNYIVTNIGQALNATRCYIGEYDFKNKKNLSIQNEYLISNKFKSLKGFNQESDLTQESMTKDIFIYDSEKYIKENNLENESDGKRFEEYGVKSGFSLPVKYNNKVLGVLIIHFDKAYAFKDEDIDFVRNVNDHIVIAINQINLYETVKKQAEQEVVLRKITQTIRSSLDIGETLKIICKEISQLFEVEKVLIIEVPEDENAILIARCQTVVNDIIKHDWPKLDKKIHPYWKKIIKENNGIVIINNINESDLPDYFKKTYEKLGTKSILSVSIRDKNNEWGAINLHKIESYKYWTKDEINLLKAICDQVYIAIKQAELYKKVQETAEREKLIRETILSLLSSISSMNIKDVFKAIVTEIGKLFEADRCFFVEYDADNNDMFPQDDYKEYVADKTVKPSSNRLNTKEELSELIKIGIHQKQIIMVENTAEVNFPEATKTLLQELSIKSFVGFPIIYGEVSLGILVLHYVKDYKKFSRDEIDTLHTIATQSGIIINQAKLYKKVQKTAEKEKMLAEIMAVIKSNLKIDEIFLIICSLLKQFYDVNRIMISKLDTAENKLNILKECNKNNNIDCQLTSKSKEYFYEKIIKNKNLIINDVEKTDNPEYFLKDLKLMNIKALMMVPIRINANETGAIIIQDNKNNNWNQEDINFLSRIADYISIAIKESNLYNQSEFITNASHELKTPLSIINGYAGALLNLEKPDCETTNKFLYIIKNNSERLNKLIDNLMFISTIEKKLDYKNMVFEELKVIDLIENSIQLCDEKIKSKNIKIEKNIENIIIQKANIILLQQLIINLITNAVNYSESCSTVSLKAIKNDKEILISVEDKGCGIKKEHLSNIFERFYRVDKSRNRETGGTGLGLSISKLISEIHGGYITVESIFGKGSIFTLYLPE